MKKVFLLFGLFITTTFQAWGEPRLVLVVKTLTEGDYFPSMKAPFERRASELGMDASVIAPPHESDIALQIEMVDDLITGRKANVIAIVPNDSKTIVPVLEDADSAGLFVIVVDTKIEGKSPWPYIGTQNFMAGKSAANFIAKRLGGKGKVAVISGPVSHLVHKERAEGFLEEMKKFENISAISWLSTRRSTGWEAVLLVDRLLSDYPDIDALFCTNDPMALGASAVIGPQKKKDIVIVGFDASLKACLKVREGPLDATIAQFPTRMAELAAETAKALLGGKRIPKEINSGFKVIDKDNVNAFIEKHMARER
jgi:ABC-type sugar transport system substrate-binding protein